MKSLILAAFMSVFIIISAGNIYAQPSGGNAILIQKIEASLTPDGSIAEFDSLTALYNKMVWDKNPYVVSHKTVRHWWGNNNRDIIEISEIRSWEDIPKAMEKNNELFMEGWPTKEAREKFNKAYDKYFTGKHSDEIYQEVVFKK